MDHLVFRLNVSGAYMVKTFQFSESCPLLSSSVAQSIWKLEAACIIWAAESGPGTAHPNPVVVPQQGMRKPRFRSLYYLFSKLLTTLAKSHNSSFKVLKRNKIDVITFLADQKKKINKISQQELEYFHCTVPESLLYLFKHSCDRRTFQTQFRMRAVLEAVCITGEFTEDNKKVQPSFSLINYNQWEIFSPIG